MKKMVEKIKERYDKLSEIENYKQLNEKLETGKNILVDYKGNNIECDKFGFPTIKYYKNVTGLKSYKSRLSKGLIKELKYDSTNYIPISPRLIGSSKYPRSLSIPLSGQIDKPEKIIKTIKKKEIYNVLKNKKIFDLKIIKKDKILPKYFNVKLGDDSPKSRKYLINLFDEGIKEIKKECNYDSDYYLKNEKLRALSNYKSFLKKNLTKNLLNGNKIPFTKQEDINLKFKISKNLIKKEGWKKTHFEQQKINQEEYDKLYKIKSIESKNNIFNKLFNNSSSFDIEQMKGDNNNSVKNNNLVIHRYNNPIKISITKDRNLLSGLISPRDKLYNNREASNYFKSRQKKISNLNSDNNYSSFQKNLSKSISKSGSAIINGLNYSGDTKMQNNLISNRKGLYSPRFFSELKLDFSNFNSQKINDTRNERKNIEDSEKNNNNIYYSQEINNENRIRKLQEIKKKCEKENKLIKGYQIHVETEEFEVDDGFIYKKKLPKFISPNEVYIKENELFKKVNPIECNRRLNKKLFEDKILMKRLEYRKIFEKIRIKKILKLNK